jgi:alkylated DNA repair dioxygenase AlkB
MSNITTLSNNLLPLDGAAFYMANFLQPAAANQLFEQLAINTPWQQDTGVIFGKSYTTERKMAWYAQNQKTYSYAGAARKALPLTATLKKLKNVVESTVNQDFNAVLLNYYSTGKEAMGWHADNENSLVATAAIASLSLGAERSFRFKHRLTGQTLTLELAHGSLLLMLAPTQVHWLHCLPVRGKILSPRINLTFRLMC